MQKWVMSIAVGFSAILAVYLLLFHLPVKEAAVNEDHSFTVPDLPIDQAKAETIYKSSCMACHGDEYQGNMGPALIHVGASLSKEKIYKQIAQGGGGMPGFKDRLSDDEIIQLANWLSTFH